MTSHGRKQFLSFLLAGIFVTGLVIIGLLVAIEMLSEDEPDATQSMRDEKQIKLPGTSQVKALTKEQIIDLGEMAVSRHASYDESSKPVILQQGAEEIEKQHWITRYKTAQQAGGIRQYFHHIVEILDAHVIGHNVQVSDFSEDFFIMNPEPDQVVSGSGLFVKGQIKGGADDTPVSLKIISSEDEEVFSKDIKPKAEGSFLDELDFTADAGQYLLEAVYDEQMLRIPFILHILPNEEL